MTLGKWKTMLVWVTGFAMVAALFVAQVWKQNEYIKLNRKHSSFQAQLEQVKNDIAAIELDNKKLKDYKRLERIGQETFGLVYAGVPEFVYPTHPKNEGIAKLAVAAATATRQLIRP